jgi:hypothetical protein
MLFPLQVCQSADRIGGDGARLAFETAREGFMAELDRDETVEAGV